MKLGLPATNHLKPGLCICLMISGLIVATSVGATVPTLTIDWNNTHQNIDGYGASIPYIASQFVHFQQKSMVMDLLFDPKVGIGLSILRSSILEQSWGTIEPSPGIWHFTGDAAQVWVQQQAQLRGVSKIVATVWSPPSWMKTNNGIASGGYLKPHMYQAFADYLAAYVMQYKARFGVNIYGVSIANEPNKIVNYGSSQWTAQNMHDFVLNNLGPTFQRNNVAAKIMMPESAGWDMSLASTTFDDPSAAAFIGVAAAHDYDMSYDPTKVAVAKMLHLPVWQTEVSDLSPSNPSIVNGLKWAINIHNHMTKSETNAWLYWAGTLDIHDSQTGQGLILFDNISGTFTVPKRFYALGHFSKFIRPGYVRLGCPSSPIAGVYMSAYKDPVAGKFVVVAINSNPVTQALNMQLNVSLQKMVKYTTTSTSNMAMATVASSVPNGNVQVSLPPQSITTFVSQH